MISKYISMVLILMALTFFSSVAMAQNKSQEHEHGHHPQEIVRADSTALDSVQVEQKLQAIKDGDYNCCIDEPCNECLIAHGTCSCKKAVKNNKAVCNDCYEGWLRGDGTVRGKTVSDIKRGHKHDTD